MRELAVQAANDTNVTADRDAIAEELHALTQEIDRIKDNTEFNTQAIFKAATTELHSKLEQTAVNK